MSNTKENQTFWALALVAVMIFVVMVGPTFNPYLQKADMAQPKLLPENRLVQPDLQTKYNELVNLNTKLVERLKRYDEKLSLMGTIVNNNFMVDQKNLPRTEYVYINADWTIDKLPTQMKMSESEKEFFNKFLKKTSSVVLEKSLVIPLEEIK